MVVDRVVVVSRAVVVSSGQLRVQTLERVAVHKVWQAYASLLHPPLHPTLPSTHPACSTINTCKLPTSVS